MQIPPATEIAWRSDLAQYLEDEDQDTFAVSTRVAAQQCVLELLDWYGRKALPALVGAVQRRMSDAAQAESADGGASGGKTDVASADAQSAKSKDGKAADDGEIDDDPLTAEQLSRIKSQQARPRHRIYVYSGADVQTVLD